MSKSPVPKFYPDSWLFPSTYRTPLKWKLASRLVMAAVGSVSKIWIDMSDYDREFEEDESGSGDESVSGSDSSELEDEWLNKTEVHNSETLRAVVESRPVDRGLVTVSNHTSCIDDPFMWGVLKMQCLLNNTCMRWTPTAEDICFTRPLHSWFFTMGQCVPVRRGCGVYQKSMDFLLEKLNMGQWIHIFPEGKVNLANDKLLRFKWGVGRLIAECSISPIVLPIVHLGMDNILPNEKPYRPQIRKNVTMLVGHPMDFAKDIELLKSLKKSPRDIRKHITDKLQEELHLLREKAIAIHSDLNR